MSKTNLSVSPDVRSPKPGQVIVLGVISTSNGIQLAKHLSDSRSLEGLDLKALGATSKAEQLVRVPGINGSVFALLGVGSDELDEDNLRELGGAVGRSLRGFSEIVLDLPTDDDRDAVALVEGALLGLYEYRSVFTKALPRLDVVESIISLSPHPVEPELLERSRVLAEAVTRVRDLVNTPPNLLFPASFAEVAKSQAKSAGISVTVLTEKELEAQGFRGIQAVGQGSSRPPRLVKLEYSPKRATKHLALVGKGITFDTGGISLKPAASMVGMKYDMTGAATVFQAISAIAALKLPVKVTSFLCLAENMPSGTAIRPNDVITTHNGKTVEVLNTDAEGRLVLADGLSAASELEPDLIIDVATLTGAARVALGDRYSALMGTADAVSAVEAAAFDSGELVWHMPLPSELRARLDSDVADIANAKIGSTSGGMLLAGVFLKEFVGKSGNDAKPQAWAHLDIAGTANNDSSAYGYTPKGATGVMLRTLVTVAEGLAR